MLSSKAASRQLLWITGYGVLHTLKESKHKIHLRSREDLVRLKKNIVTLERNAIVGIRII